MEQSIREKRRGMDDLAAQALCGFFGSNAAQGILDVDSISGDRLRRNFHRNHDVD
jgi:hypothetical protein